MFIQDSRDEYQKIKECLERIKASEKSALDNMDFYKRECEA